MNMIISWRYSQKVEILEYDLYNEKIVFKSLCNIDGLKEGEIYTVDFSSEERVPDIARTIELIETQYDFYLYD